MGLLQNLQGKQQPFFFAHGRKKSKKNQKNGFFLLFSSWKIAITCAYTQKRVLE